MNANQAVVVFKGKGNGVINVPKYIASLTNTRAAAKTDANLLIAEPGYVAAC